MTTQKVFFRPNIVAEPLFNQWYAWPYLIPPASAAMYLANSHLKIMRSFAAAPQVHVNALKNPAMLGGPFIYYDASRVSAITRLYQHLHEITGDIDLLFLGMECDGAPMSWLYGPLLTRPLARKHDQSRRFDGSTYDKGIGIVNILRPQQVYVYAMGQEPWCSFLTSIAYTEQPRPIIESNKLVAECARRGLVAERLFGRKEIPLGRGAAQASSATRP